MGLDYRNLDAVTRGYMTDESKAHGGHYPSPRLTQQGLDGWVALFEEALAEHIDDWLANQVLARSWVRSEENYTRDGITRPRRVNQPHAALQLAEGEFNRFYIRGLCRRAINDGIEHVVVYRAKEVDKPRPESVARLGAQIDPNELLAVLRTTDFVEIERVFGVPGGPNSGLSARLP